MKYTIELIETALKLGEVELTNAQNAVKAAERTLGEARERVEKNIARATELRAVLAELKAPKPQASPAAEEKQVNGSGKLARTRPDAASLKISQR